MTAKQIANLIYFTVDCTFKLIRHSLKMNGTHAFLSYGMNTSNRQQKRRSTKKRMERPTSTKKEEAWNGLYPLPDDNDNNAVQ